MTDKYPYKLIDSKNGKVIGAYRAKTIALRDCERNNVVADGYRFYVLKPDGGKVTA